MSGHLFVRIRGRLVHMPVASLTDGFAHRRAARARFFRERDAAGYRQSVCSEYDRCFMALFTPKAYRAAYLKAYGQEPR